MELRDTARAADGHELAVTRFPAEGRAWATLLVAGAMGVRQDFYEPIARFLAENGVHALTFDYRGMGASREASLRGFRTDVTTWAQSDLDAMLREARATDPGLPAFALGHSLGGQLFGSVREGARLDAILREKLGRMREGVTAIAPMLPKVLTDYQDRLAARLRDAVANLDEDRIRQELGVFAARIDVAEELARLTTHIDEVERVLSKGGAVGKRLDFLMQELNREANTIASKASGIAVTNGAVALKLLIEQLREQVQNME